MGDRANVGIRGTDGNTIFLYIHWGGFDRHEIVANAIRHAMKREGDESYFTRIFISRVIGTDWDKETGVGLAINSLPSSGEDGYDVPIFNYKDKTITVHEEKWDGAGGYVDLTDFERYTVEEYLSEYALGSVSL